MTNIKFKWFTDPNILGTIRVKHLAQFFAVFKDEFAASNLPLPDVLPGPGPYVDAWALLNHSGDLPFLFIQAIQVIENLASPEHRSDLEAAVRQALAGGAPLDPKDSPQCLALQIWLWARYPEQMLIVKDEPKVEATVAPPQPRALQELPESGLVAPACHDETHCTVKSNGDEPTREEPSTPPPPSTNIMLQPLISDSGEPIGPQPLVAPKSHGSTLPPSTNCYHRYKGKIGRLPHEVREQINLLLYDGLPYDAIIEKLGDAGKGLKPYHLTRWKKTGYRDWLKEQERRDLTRAKDQFALDVLLDKDSSKVHEASAQVAASMLCQFLAEFDLTALKEKLQNDPLNFVRLINTLPKLSESGIKCESHRVEIAGRREARERSKHPLVPGLSEEAREIIERERFDPPPHW